MVFVRDAVGDLEKELFRAIYERDVKKIRELKAQGADLEFKDDFGRTVLILATGMGELELVKVLLELKADVNATTNNGVTALIAACANGERQIAEALLNHEANMEAGDSVYGRTALIWAVIEGHFEVVKLLLDRGADAEAEDNDKLKALDRAREKGYETIERLLEVHLADRHQRGNEVKKLATSSKPSQRNQKGPNSAARL